MARESGLVVGLDQDGAEGGFALGGCGARARAFSRKAGERRVHGKTDDRFVVAAHADVRDVGCALGQNAVVGRRHVGMGAHSQRHAAVGQIGERLFLARRFAVDVENDRIHGLPEPMLLQRLLDAGEGLADGVHEKLSEHLEDEDRAAVLRMQQRTCASRRSLRVVAGTDQPAVGLDIAFGAALVPGVVAKGDHVGADLIEGFAYLRSNAEAAGGVLAVHDHEIERELLAQVRQAFRQDVAAGAAHDIAAEQDAHPLAPLVPRIRPCAG